MKLWHKVILGLVLGVFFGYLVGQTSYGTPEFQAQKLAEYISSDHVGDAQKVPLSTAMNKLLGEHLEQPVDLTKSTDISEALTKAIAKKYTDTDLPVKAFVSDIKAEWTTDNPLIKYKSPTLFSGFAESVGWDISPDAFLTEYIKPIGTIFINLIKMVVIPLIFFSLISGVTSMADQSAFKRVGVKALLAFLITAAFAVCIGLFFATVFKPGLGVDLSSLRDLSAGTVLSTSQHANGGLIDLIVNIFPSNVFKAMVEDHILQVVVFAIFVAMTMNSIRERAPMVVEFCHQVAQVVFKLIETIIKFSPYGVFALTAWVVGTQGFDILYALLKLIAVVLGALFTQYLIFGVMIVAFAKLSPMPFYKKMLEPQSIAFSTSSSKATLSTVMRVLNERLGVSKTSTSFVLPLGASINMDGTAIYLAICSLFFAQAFDIPIDTHHYMILVLTATLGSIGAAGIPGGSLIMMGMVLTSVGLPVEGIALIAGIDRILDMLRTTVNITGDAAVTLIIDKSEGTFDEVMYNTPEHKLS